MLFDAGAKPCRPFPSLNLLFAYHSLRLVIGIFSLVYDRRFYYNTACYSSRSLSDIQTWGLAGCNASPLSVQPLVDARRPWYFVGLLVEDGPQLARNQRLTPVTLDITFGCWLRFEDVD